MNNGDQHEQGAAKWVYRKTAIDDPAVMPERRWTLLAGIVVVLLFTVTSIMVFHARSFLDHFESKVESEAGGDDRLTAIGQHMQSLQGKFSGLLVESVEMRLKELEQKIELGHVGVDDVKTFEQLKQDLMLLQDYVATASGKPLESGYTEHIRFQRVESPTRVVRNDELMTEMAEIKELFLLFLISLGTASVLGGGLWLRQQRRHRDLGALTYRTSLLTPTTADRDH